MTQPPRAPLTLADFLAIPGGSRFHELIGGELISRALPAASTVTRRRGWWARCARPFSANPVGLEVDPRDATLTVMRWSPAGYVTVLVAERGERVRAEPFEAVELELGTLFGDDPA